MNGELKNIWTRPLKGPGALLVCALVVSSAGLLFAVAVAGFAYFNAPWALIPRDAKSPIFIEQMKLWAVLLGLELAAIFSAAVAVAFAFDCAIRRLLAPRISGAPAMVQEPANSLLSTQPRSETGP